MVGGLAQLLVALAGPYIIAANYIESGLAEVLALLLADSRLLVIKITV